MAEYKITALDNAPPKQWSGPNGTVYYINVGLEGHPKPVSIGKKSPDSLKVGDTVYGTIIPTDYLTDKWKGEAAAPSTPATPRGDNKYLKDITDLPARFIQALLPYQDVQSLEPDTEQYFRMLALAKALASDAAQMIEELRTGSLSTDTTPEPETKAQSKAAGDLKSKLAESSWVPDDEVHE